MFAKWFRRKEETNRTMVEVYEDLYEEMDKLVDDCLKATGTSMADMLGDLDEESGALVGRCMDSIKRTMELAKEQALIMDRVESKIDKLNENLLKQNQTLMSLNSNVGKISKERA